jgi:hypothetical protein
MQNWQFRSLNNSAAIKMSPHRTDIHSFAILFCHTGERRYPSPHQLSPKVRSGTHVQHRSPNLDSGLRRNDGRAGVAHYGNLT